MKERDVFAEQRGITRERFIRCVGREPVGDDLDRCNCPNAGMLMHWGCGWDHERNLPQFMVGAKPKGERT